jgi:hypothetical protein
MRGAVNLDEVKGQMPADWHRVQTDADVEQLLSTFGGFHDGCLREAHIWTETYVTEDLTMACPGHLDTHVRLLFQRQWRDPSAIELLFDQVIAFHLAPSPENYGSEIADAALLIQDGIIYWAESWQWRPEHPERDESTWIAAKQLRWRDASSWMGEQLRYGPGPEG